jgi:hypothetical protein
MMNFTGKSLMLVAFAILALCGFSSQAVAENRTYSFVNSSNREVTLYLIYPPGTAPGPGAITQMKLKPGNTWNYTLNSSLPNIRVDLAGGTWKDFKGAVLFAGANPGGAPGGTYAIK